MESSRKEHLIKETITFYEVASGYINPKHYVDVSGSKVGKKLISDSFSPCQPVLAVLDNGNYALYHAASYRSNLCMKPFIDAIKGKVEHVFVFQKSFPSANLVKAPLITIELARELDCEVNRVHVEDYTGIYVNADKHEVILFGSSSYASSNKTNINFSGKKIEIDKDDIISMENTVKEMSQTHKYRIGENSILLDNDLAIPNKFTYNFFNSEKQNPKDKDIVKNKRCTLF